MNKATRIVTIFAMAALLSLCAAAGAVDSVYCTGKILKVADDGMSMTVKMDRPKKSDSMEITFPEKRKVRYYLYMPGKMDDVKDGVWVKTYGKVAEDHSVVEKVGSVMVLPSKSTSASKRRIDGQVMHRDGKLFLKRGNEETEVQMRKDCKFSVITKATKDEVKPGVKFAMNGIDKDGSYEVYNEMRFFVDRRDDTK